MKRHEIEAPGEGGGPPVADRGRDEGPRLWITMRASINLADLQAHIAAVKAECAAKAAEATNAERKGGAE